MRKAFDMVDIDKSGFLDREELRKMLAGVEDSGSVSDA